MEQADEEFVRSHLHHQQIVKLLRDLSSSHFYVVPAQRGKKDINDIKITEIFGPVRLWQDRRQLYLDRLHR
jgi:hypothetical protein